MDAARMVLGFLDASRRGRRAKADLQPKGRSRTLGAAVIWGSERQMGMSKIKITFDPENEEAWAYCHVALNWVLPRFLLQWSHWKQARMEEFWARSTIHGSFE